MREIKFRYFYKPETERLPSMAYSDSYGLKSFWGIVEHFKGGNIMQFTGLHDKNGKEIYESDLVKSDWLRDEQRITGSTVIFSSGRFTCKGLKYDLYLYPELEVIGSIYETPKLTDEETK